MPGITVAEECKVVNLIGAVDINGNGANSDAFSMENYAHATVICSMGAESLPSAITVKENTSAAGAGATYIGFDYYAEETTLGDTLGDRTTATTAGITGTTGANIFYVIELDADELSDGYPWVTVHFADSSGAKVMSCVGVLSGSRYAQAVPPTAIA